MTSQRTSLPSRGAASAKLGVVDVLLTGISEGPVLG